MTVVMNTPGKYRSNKAPLNIRHKTFNPDTITFPADILMYSGLSLLAVRLCIFLYRAFENKKNNPKLVINNNYIMDSLKYSRINFWKARKQLVEKGVITEDIDNNIIILNH